MIITKCICIVRPMANGCNENENEDRNTRAGKAARYFDNRIYEVVTSYIVYILPDAMCSDRFVLAIFFISLRLYFHMDAPQSNKKIKRRRCKHSQQQKACSFVSNIWRYKRLTEHIECNIVSCIYLCYCWRIKSDCMNEVINNGR